MSGAHGQAAQSCVGKVVHAKGTGVATHPDQIMAAKVVVHLRGSRQRTATARKNVQSPASGPHGGLGANVTKLASIQDSIVIKTQLENLK